MHGWLLPCDFNNVQQQVSELQNDRTAKNEFKCLTNAKNTQTSCKTVAKFRQICGKQNVNANYTEINK